MYIYSGVIVKTEDGNCGTVISSNNSKVVVIKTNRGYTAIPTREVSVISYEKEDE